MAKLPLYAAGITASFTILLTTAAAQDAALLKQAQELFQPLPKDMATAEFPITRERVELGEGTWWSQSGAFWLFSSPFSPSSLSWPCCPP